MFQAEVGHAHRGKVVELAVGKYGRRLDGEQDLHEREQIRVFRCRQIDERLDRTLSDALTQAIVFRANLLLTGMRRPFYSKSSKLLHSDFDRAIGAVQGGVERNTQACNDRDIARAFGTLVTLVEACQQEGSLPRGDTLQLALVAWCTVHGIAKLAIAGRLPFHTKAKIFHFAAYVIDRTLPPGANA